MDAPLDMRMNKNDSLRAFDVINTYSAQELKRILFEYGEEKFSQPIVNAIIKRRSVSPIQTTLELAELIKEAFPKNARFEGKHPARRTFQAIRIEVNRELEIIRPTILKIVDKLNKGGRLAVITFHSLEDRIVKTTFNSLIDGCTCPKDFPVCVCGYKQKVKQVYKKPIIATEKELSENSRSRSAKLRVIEKI